MPADTMLARTHTHTQRRQPGNAGSQSDGESVIDMQIESVRVVFIESLDSFLINI